MNDDEPVDVRLFRVGLELGTRDGHMQAIAGVSMGARDTVLSMPERFKDNETLAAEFTQLAVHIAQAMGMAQGEAQGLHNCAGVFAVKVEGDSAALPLAAHHPAANDSAADGNEFTVAVVQEKDYVVAYVVAMAGQNAQPGDTPPIASINDAFMGDEDVQERFRSLLEAIGVCIARSAMQDEEDDNKPGAGAPPLQ